MGLMLCMNIVFLVVSRGFFLQLCKGHITFTYLVFMGYISICQIYQCDVFVSLGIHQCPVCPDFLFELNTCKLDLMSVVHSYQLQLEHCRLGCMVTLGYEALCQLYLCLKIYSFCH